MKTILPFLLESHSTVTCNSMTIHSIVLQLASTVCLAVSVWHCVLDSSVVMR